jgi:hypothetical protein
VAAAEQLAADGLPEGRGFTTYTWGSYLDYALPVYHPFVDSRSDTYGQTILQQYLDIVGLAPDWRSLLESYHIRWALLPASEPLAQVLALVPGWSCLPADHEGVAVLCREAALVPAPTLSAVRACRKAIFAGGKLTRHSISLYALLRGREARHGHATGSWGPHSPGCTELASIGAQLFEQDWCLGIEGLAT